MSHTAGRTSSSCAFNSGVSSKGPWISVGGSVGRYTVGRSVSRLILKRVRARFPTNKWQYHGNSIGNRSSEHIAGEVSFLIFDGY